MSHSLRDRFRPRRSEPLFPLEIFGEKLASAILSPCGVYRYTLTRQLNRGAPLSGDKGTVNFIMLNPSTADANQDDPTIRRCMGFAKNWGYSRLVVTNLFAMRSTDPKVLRTTNDPVGSDNDYHIANEARLADLVVCAWGTHGAFAGRDRQVLSILLGSGATLTALALTKTGQPRHPLYLPSDCQPVLLESA